MALTVLQVGFPLVPVGPEAVGGAEQVVSQLDRALVAAGHRSIVVAPVGSRCAGELVPIPAPPPIVDRAAWRGAHEAARAAAARVVAAERIDLLHLHGADYHLYLPAPGPTVLVTLHLPAAVYPPVALRPARPRTYLHCVSASQRALMPPGVPFLPDVENGVDLARFRPARRRRAYALALGRICEEKGFHLALDAAARAGVPLLLGGVVHPFPEHQRHFEAEIRPRLGPGRLFLGPLGLARKRRLLAGARCVVVPSLVPETCSLVALEALASGAPVVGFRRGALPDLVEHGRTGFLVDSVEGLAGAIAEAGLLRSEDCRRAAERHGLDRTLRSYLALYARLAAEA